MATDEERLVVDLEARIRDFEKNFKKANQVASQNWSAIEARGKQASTRVNANLASIGTAATKAAGGIKTLAMSFAGGFAIGSLTQLPGLIKQVVGETAKIADVADKVGLTTERLQELRFAAEQSGMSTEDLDSAMAQFSRRIGEAATGTGDLYKILKANNVAIKDANGNIRPLNDLFNDYANLIQNAGSEQEALTLATDAFGRSGDGMVLMLNNGSAGLADLTVKAREAGAVMEDELVRAAADADDAFAKWGTTLKVLAATEITTFVSETQRMAGELETLGNKATSAWEKFEQVYNRVFRISPEEAAAHKLRAQLIKDMVTGASQIPTYPTDIRPAPPLSRAPYETGRATTPTVIPAAGAKAEEPKLPAGTVQISTPSGLTATVNRVYAQQFEGFLSALENKGYLITSLGGYNYRNIAGTNKLSQHAYGAAIDINPLENPVTYGRTVTNMPADISALAAQFGLQWGGDWKSKKDPMHFEAVRSMEDVAAAKQATEDKAQADEDAAQAAKDKQDAIDGVVTSLQFEGLQIGRTAEQQELYNRLKEAGVTLDSSAGQSIQAEVAALYSKQQALDATTAAQEAANQRLQEFSSMEKEAIGGFLHDVKDGVQPLEALSRALDRLTVRLLDLTLDTLFTSTGGTSIIASMFGGVGKLFGFQSGGYTGDAGGIVHPREFVIRASQVGKHRNLLEAVNANRLPGYARGGLVGTPNFGARPSPSHSTSRDVTNTAVINVYAKDADSFRKTKGQIEASIAVALRRASVRNN